LTGVYGLIIIERRYVLHATCCGRKMNNGKLSPGFSLFLDALRFFAAATVFFLHSPKPAAIRDAIDVYHFEHDAVVIFFVLSGYVVAFAAEQRDRTASNFFASRAARILSVSVPAIVFTVALNLLCPTLIPLWPKNISAGELFSWAANSAVFTNHIWNSNVVLVTQQPYWSLAFEVWFYAIFACAYFATGAARWLGALALCVLAGPATVALLPVWLIGVGLYHVHKRWQPDVPMAGMLVAAALVIYALLKATIGKGEYAQPFAGEWLADPLWVNFGIRMDWATLFTWDFLVGGVLGVLILAAPALLAGVRANGRSGNVIRFFAGFSFSLYLFQAPLIWATKGLMTGAHWYAFPFYYAGLLGIIWALSTFTERRKDVVRRLIQQLIGPRPASSAPLVGNPVAASPVQAST
jgi:peptidoglycan/LPS O-acetylase OafA/YrhL